MSAWVEIQAMPLGRPRQKVRHAGLLTRAHVPGRVDSLAIL